MKQTTLIIALIALSLTSSAQEWSETEDNHTTGKLGLGTASPAAKLQVQSTGISALIGSDVSAGTLTNSTRKFARVGVPHYLNAEEPVAGFVFDSDQFGNIVWIGGGSNQFNTSTEIRFATASTTTNLGTNNVDNVKMVINSSGNIGIGTPSPKQKLHVEGRVHLGVHESGSGAWYQSTSGSNWFAGLNGSNKWRVYKDGNKLVIDENGNVGIGTEDPISKLSVNGGIRAKEVKVLAEISVPDYVFEPDFDLRTLKETKEYITKNKHLPEIPSATEIGKNGFDLGDMNMRLLKKIEELTLYQIDLLEKLEKQNNRLLEVEKELQSIKN